MKFTKCKSPSRIVIFATSAIKASLLYCLLCFTSFAYAESFKAALKQTKNKIKAQEFQFAYQDIRPYLTRVEKKHKGKLRKLFRKNDDFFEYSISRLLNEYNATEDIVSYDLFVKVTNNFSELAPKGKDLTANYKALDLVVIRKTISKEIDIAFGDALETRVRYEIPASEKIDYETVLFHNTLGKIAQEQRVSEDAFSFLMNV